MGHRLREKNFLDSAVEQLGDLKRQRQAGIVPAGLYSIDRLTGYVEPRRKIRLRPVPLRTEDFEPIFHVARTAFI